MAASSSDADRLALWVHEHARAVRGYLLALVRRPEDADDLLQEVFRKAWLTRENYEERGQERAYLLRIADRLVCDRGRKDRSQKSGREVNLDEDGWSSVEPAATDEMPDERLLRDEWRVELAEALEALTESQKRVLFLRYYGELDFAAIAEQVSQPLSTVLSHCRRGLEALRKILNQKDPT